MKRFAAFFCEVGRALWSLPLLVAGAVYFAGDLLTFLAFALAVHLVALAAERHSHAKAIQRLLADQVSELGQMRRVKDEYIGFLKQSRDQFQLRALQWEQNAAMWRMVSFRFMRRLQHYEPGLTLEIRQEKPN